MTRDSNVATGAGHHSVISIPEISEYYFVYHRRPLGEIDGNHREICIDRMHFNKKDFIKPVKITFKGINVRTLK